MAAERVEARESASVAFVVTPADMRAFAALSGDENPIHHDAAFARARGFEEPIAYGGLVIAQVSRLLGMEIPGPGCVWRSIALDFRRPLYVGREARATATVRHRSPGIGAVVLGLAVVCDGVRIAEGEATALAAPPRGAGA